MVDLKLGPFLYSLMASHHRDHSRALQDQPDWSASLDTTRATHVMYYHYVHTIVDPDYWATQNGDIGLEMRPVT
ncbi:hypothetical protein LTR01_008522 [Friedmanniomyces endolithicus]|nr:hypothetical protein LTS09_017810 [Friedmanniomyces endolithicus]KAK0302755.1 hypothetical protein LTR01_008522 [Friedmanniomyces endolithicus]KAK0823299.1 hypothetical protein LTR73_008614 [Friedmanniomyces endolithicus]